MTPPGGQLPRRRSRRARERCGCALGFGAISRPAMPAADAASRRRAGGAQSSSPASMRRWSGSSARRGSPSRRSTSRRSMPRRRRRFRTSIPTTELPPASVSRTSSMRCALRPMPRSWHPATTRLRDCWRRRSSRGAGLVLDVGDFDTTSDAAFVERLYIPGLRRAGDSATATALAGDRVVIHNTGDRFMPASTAVRREKLTPREIVALLRR